MKAAWKVCSYLCLFLMAHTIALQAVWAVKQGDGPLAEQSTRQVKVRQINLEEAIDPSVVGLVIAQESAPLLSMNPTPSSDAASEESSKLMLRNYGAMTSPSEWKDQEQTISLEDLFSMETSRPRSRWAYLNHFLESLGAWAFIGERDVNPNSSTNHRVFIKGHGLWVHNQGALRKLYATNGFRQGVEFILHRAVHMGLLGLTIPQLISSTSFNDFIHRFWNGDEYAIKALAYATSRTQALNGLYALLALPFIWGGVKAGLYADSAQDQKRTSIAFSQAIQKLKEECIVPSHSWWRDGVRWALPLHPLDRNLNSIVRALRWDGRLTSEEYQEGYRRLIHLYDTRQGYTKIVAAFHLAQLADSPHLKELGVLREALTPELLQTLELMKRESLKEVKKLATFSAKEEWAQAGRVKKIEILTYFLYGRYLQWWLGLAPTKKEEAAFWAYKAAKNIFSLAVIKTVIQALIDYASCPKKQGVTFTGEAPWASDFSEECFDAYVKAFNTIPGQPAFTLTNIIPQIKFNDNQYQLNLASKSITAPVLTEILNAFANNGTQLITADLSNNINGQDGDAATCSFAQALCRHPDLQELNLGGNNLGVVRSYSRQTSQSLICVANCLRHLTKLRILDLNNNGIGSNDALDDSGTIALASSIGTITQLQELNLGSNALGSQDNLNANGTIAMGKGIGQLWALKKLNLSFNNIGAHDGINSHGTEAIAHGLETLTRLETLSFFSNSLGSSDDTNVNGTIAIGRGLGTLINLLELNLGRIYFFSNYNVKGQLALAEGIGKATKLTSLNLFDSGIGLRDNLTPQGTVALGKSLGKLPSLTFLDLSVNYIGTRDAINPNGTIAIGQGIGLLTNLQILYFLENNIGYAGAVQTTGTLSIAQGLAKLGNLRTFSFYNQWYYPGDPETIYWINEALQLTKAPRLKVPLSSMELIDSYFTALPSHITALDLSQIIPTPNITLINYIFDHLISFKNLTVLTISNSGIGGDDNVGLQGTMQLSKRLSELYNLRELYLGLNHIGYYDYDPDLVHATIAFAEGLEQLAKLEILSLESNNLGENDSINSKGTQSIGNSLGKLSKLRKLSLNSNYIGNGDNINPAGTKAIGEGIGQMIYLEELNMNNNGYLGYWDNTNSAGTLAVVQGLRNLAQLQILDFHECSLGNGDAADTMTTVELGNSISNLKELQYFNLDYNKIGCADDKNDSGTLSIMNGISSATNLNTLILNHNCIGLGSTAPTLQLANSLQRLKNVSYVDISNNPIGAAGQQETAAILQSLASMPHLPQFYLQGIMNISWTDAATLLVLATDNTLQKACQTNICYGTPVNNSVPTQVKPSLEELQTSTASSLRPPALLSVPLEWLTLVAKPVIESIWLPYKHLKLDLLKGIEEPAHIEALPEKIVIPGVMVPPSHLPKVRKGVRKYETISYSRSIPSSMGISDIALMGATALYVGSKAIQGSAWLASKIKEWWRETQESINLEGSTQDKISDDLEVEPWFQERRLNAFSKFLSNLKGKIAPFAFTLLGRWYNWSLENYESDIDEFRARSDQPMTKKELRELGLDIGFLAKSILQDIGH
jgi:hypothetical protein